MALGDYSAQLIVCWVDDYLEYDIQWPSQQLTVPAMADEISGSDLLAQKGNAAIPYL